MSIIFIYGIIIAIRHHIYSYNNLYFNIKSVFNLYNMIIYSNDDAFNLRHQINSSHGVLTQTYSIIFCVSCLQKFSKIDVTKIFAKQRILNL